MRLVIAVVGRLRQGPEANLIADYLDRHAKAGRALGLPAVTVAEVEDKRGGGMTAEAPLLERAIPDGAAIVCQGTQCSLPVTTAEELAALLRG